MATQKRRVIYLSDEEWAEAKRLAEARRESISAYIGGFIRAYEVKLGKTLGLPASRRVEFSQTPSIRAPEFHPVPKPSQKKR